MAVVKSQAYGHGAVEVSRAALSSGASRLGVNEVSEGVELRDAGFTVPIQLLTSCLPEELAGGIESQLTFAVACIDEIKALADRSRATLPRRRGRTPETSPPPSNRRRVSAGRAARGHCEQ